MWYMFQVQCREWYKNQPSNSTSCSDNIVRLRAQNMLTIMGSVVTIVRQGSKII